MTFLKTKTKTNNTIACQTWIMQTITSSPTCPDCSWVCSAGSEEDFPQQSRAVGAMKKQSWAGQKGEEALSGAGHPCCPAEKEVASCIGLRTQGRPHFCSHTCPHWRVEHQPSLPQVGKMEISWPLTAQAWAVQVHLYVEFFPINSVQYCKCIFSPLWFS